MRKLEGTSIYPGCNFIIDWQSFVKKTRLAMDVRRSAEFTVSRGEFSFPPQVEIHISSAYNVSNS